MVPFSKMLAANYMKKDYTYVELFAECSGLSLGLKSCGWNLELANELSPIVAETFAYNLLRTDINDPGEKSNSVR